MAFCVRCGAPMDDDAAFCTACGQGAGQPVTASVTSPVRQFTLNNNILILSLLGCMALSLLLSFIGNVGSGFLSALIGAAASGVLIYGVFLCWSQGAKTGAYPTAGFTIVKVFTIIEIVVYALGALGCLLASLLCFAAQGLISEIFEDLVFDSDDFYELFEDFVDAWNIGGWDEFCGLVGTLFFLFAAYFVVLIILYCVPMLKHLGSMKAAVTADGPVLVPSVLPVMMFVTAGVSFISMFILPTSVLGVFSTLISMGSAVLGGLLLFKAKKELVH